MDTLQVAGMISKELKRSGVVDKESQLASNIAMSFSNAGLTLCYLNPLAELLGCAPEIGEIEIAASEWVNRPAHASAARYCAQVAQALNWERTEFDTLDELLDELRERSSEIEVRDVCTHCGGTGEMHGGQHTFGCTYCGGKGYVLAPQPTSGFAEGGYAPDMREPAPTAAVLHGTEYYPGSTILPQTAQLVAWRDADGQEHCERAHRVTLNPDRDGLAAAILSGIAGAQIAPEHIAELRAQMGGVL